MQSQKINKAYLKHHRFLFFFINRDICTMNPGVSAKVPKSDIRVPKRKSEVSKCESDCQARNLSIVQKCKMSAGSSGKKNNNKESNKTTSTQAAITGITLFSLLIYANLQYLLIQRRSWIKSIQQIFLGRSGQHRACIQTVHLWKVQCLSSSKRYHMNS